MDDILKKIKKKDGVSKKSWKQISEKKIYKNIIHYL